MSAPFSISADFIAEHNAQLADATTEDYDGLKRALARRGIDADALVQKVMAFGVAIPTWGVGTGGTGIVVGRILALTGGLPLLPGRRGNQPGLVPAWRLGSGSPDPGTAARLGRAFAFEPVQAKQPRRAVVGVFGLLTMFAQGSIAGFVMSALFVTGLVAIGVGLPVLLWRATWSSTSGRVTQRRIGCRIW